jgi:23S rRNA (cytidine2498-2'-O)-methyltransferase
VTGIDPAEMEEALLKEETFTHVRGRAKELPRRLFSNFRWLASDASAVPNYSLDTIEAIVTHSSVKIEGLLLTLKFTDWKLADEIPLYHKRIRSWGYQNVRSRQLAFNRREICVAATKD